MNILLTSVKPYAASGKAIELKQMGYRVQSIWKRNGDGTVNVKLICRFIGGKRNGNLDV